MKKILLSLLLFVAVATKLSAQTPGEIKFWYYPSQNVYYNEASGNYWYFDATSKKWTWVKQLPTTYTVITATDERYPVTYKNNDVWMDNKTHTVKYKKHKTKIKENSPLP